MEMGGINFRCHLISQMPPFISVRHLDKVPSHLPDGRLSIIRESDHDIGVDIEPSPKAMMLPVTFRKNFCYGI